MTSHSRCEACASLDAPRAARRRAPRGMNARGSSRADRRTFSPLAKPRARPSGSKPLPLRERDLRPLAVDSRRPPRPESRQTRRKTFFSPAPPPRRVDSPSSPPPLFVFSPTSGPVAFRPLALARRAAASRASTRVTAVATPVRFAEPDPVVSPRPDVAMPSMEDPWTDPKWRDVKWTIYRDVAYDLQPFVDKHPGGNWLLNLSIQRDCTALIESYHLRPEVSEARFRGLPVLEDFPVNAVPKSPRPNDSELYNAIRTRVRKELFPQEGKALHRTGGDAAAATIIGFAAACYAAYFNMPGIVTGAFLGLAGAWIGLTIQHCGNHGAMSPKVWVNNALGLTDDLIGGSSLMWRYHHQVSHHIHCNDNALDQDVHTAMPLLRFDARQPRKWFHKFQHLYLFLAFPLMQVAFQVGDITGLITKDCEGAKLHGATALELATVVAGKIAHFGLLLGPALAHGWAAVGAGCAAFVAVQGMVLACTFAVSHNVAEAKIPQDTGGEAWERDWGVQQLVTSADWGGKIGNFFTGGLNLQVEHHLFPAICFVHYPAIAKIVKEEAAKFGVPYSSYRTLPGIFVEFMKFVKEMGTAEQIGNVPIDEVKHVNKKLCPIAAFN